MSVSRLLDLLLHNNVSLYLLLHLVASIFLVAFMLFAHLLSLYSHSCFK